MELDDLRRQWQQSTPPDAALSERQLTGWLARGPGGLVTKMQRNARWEAVLIVVLAVGAAAAGPFLSPRIYQLVAAAMVLLGLGLLYYYHRVLAILRQMAATDGRVRAHLQRLCAGLRQLLRFNYYLTLATGPTMMAMIFAYSAGHELGRTGGLRPGRLLAAGAGLLALGGVMYLGARGPTRWYLRRLYGRHLDRLEANLRELDEPGPGA